MKIIIFDTETTGFWRKGYALGQQPYIIQWGSVECTIDDPQNMEFHSKIDKLFKPQCKYIPKQASDIHGITMDKLRDKPLIHAFIEDDIMHRMESADLILAHNASFDMNMLWIEAARIDERLAKQVASRQPKVFCTMKTTTNLVKIPKWKGGFKRPKLQELHKHLFGSMFADAHDAFADVEATGRCFAELMKRGMVDLENKTVNCE